MTPDEVLELQHGFEAILKRHHKNVEHKGNDRVVDDYIFSFKLTPCNYGPLRKSIDEIKRKFDFYHIDTCLNYESDENIFDIIICYPDD